MKSIHTPYFRVINVEFLNQTRLHQAPIAIQEDHFGIEKYICIIYTLFSDGSRLGTRNPDFGSAVEEWV